jgi:hypothetical protein
VLLLKNLSFWLALETFPGIPQIFDDSVSLIPFIEISKNFASYATVVPNSDVDRGK